MKTSVLPPFSPYDQTRLLHLIEVREGAVDLVLVAAVLMALFFFTPRLIIKEAISYIHSSPRTCRTSGTSRCAPA